METTRKNFDKNIKMNIICSKDKLHPVYSCIHFISGFAYATDGVMLVKNRISEISTFDDSEIEALNGKSIHMDFYRDMLKYDEVLISDEGVECHKGDNKAFFYFSEFDKKPDFEAVINDAMNKQTTPLPQVSFDMRKIKDLNSALGVGNQCIVTFKGVGNAMIVEGIKGENNLGLLMPIYTGK